MPFPEFASLPASNNLLISSWDGLINVAIESMSISGFIATVAVGSSANMYHLRNFNNSFYSKCVDVRIKCVRPISRSSINAGFAAGAVEGRLALKHFCPPNQDNDGYAFRCIPKAKEKRHNTAAVNDIVFSPSVYGAFITGDNDGYVTMWNALLDMPKFENSIASLSYNFGGQLRLLLQAIHTKKQMNC